VRVRAVVFDMDGLLVDSEPIWKETETEVYGGAGVPITPELALRTKGLLQTEVADYWHRVHPYDAEPAELARAVAEGVVRRIRERGRLLPGARAALDFVAAKGVPVALASSSPPLVIDAVLERFGLRPSFAVVRSAETESHGKPHPAIYVSTCRELGVPPLDTVAFEDSLNGVIAAKAARTTCVAVPAAHERDDPRFALADLVLPSLEALDEATWSRITEPEG
jgi:sugar-phosphatase